MQDEAASIVGRYLAEATSDAEKELIVAASHAAMEKALPETLAQSAVPLADALDRNTPRLLLKRRKLQRQFERDLFRVWQEGLDRLEALLHAHMEFGDKYFQDGFHPEAEPRTARFEALAQLHARSCRVGGEILHLLKGGYADGAHARWRTLHELAVVTLFLSERAEEVAERYLLHATIRSLRVAEHYTEHQDAIGWGPLEENVLSQLRNEAEELFRRFGRSFGGEYGWAADTATGRAPGIADLERAANLSHWRPFHRWASDGIHAGPAGLQPNGVDEHGECLLLAGPSNAGLTDPGQSMAVSLSILCAALQNDRPSLDYAAMQLGFDVLVERCQNALLDCESRLGSENG